MTRKRPMCSRCLRPLKTCICALAADIDNPVELVIVQHPDEVNNAKNSARLLALSTKYNQLLVGETFIQAQLQEVCYGGNKQPILLYPKTAEENALGLTSPPPLPDLTGFAASQLRLVVLDGTWRKSRKQLYLNPLLQQLPRLELRHPPASLYRIRKAHSDFQLSTLEASCYALQQLDATTDYQPLLKAFSLFVEQVAQYLPHLAPNNNR